MTKATPTCIRFLSLLVIVGSSNPCNRIPVFSCINRAPGPEFPPSNPKMGLSDKGLPAAASSFTCLSIGIIALLLLSCLGSCAHGIGQNETDRAALLRFKEELLDPLGALESWNTSIHFCQWSGVSCGRRHERVTALSLDSRKLSGIISPYIGNLSFLRVLNLKNNSFSSMIPPEIGHLSRLQTLILNNNSFGGVIPSNLSACSRLVSINLGFNMLEGNLPASLGSLSKLKGLILQVNSLTGEIPHSFGNLSSLQAFTVMLNNFTGRIPDELGNLRNLNILVLGVNHFTGTIPSSIFNISSIATLNMAENQLEGSLPDDLGISLPNLQDLGISDNQLTGKIPESISNVSNLMQLEIVLNNFSGRVPSFEKMKMLQWFSIGQNQLGSQGADDLNFLCSLTNSTALETLGIQSNNFGGTMPECIGDLSITILAYSWSENTISGSLPRGIGNLVNLEVLEMQDNRMSGVIPSEVGSLKNLGVLDLSRNNFSGIIPPSIGNLTKLIILTLYNNNLNGPIPSSLNQCQNLLLLDLADNSLNGSIPPGVISISSLSIYADFSDNNLTGELPLEVGRLNNLRELRVQGNRLSGKIPSSLGSCVKLESLFMQDNLFEGSIPSTLSSLKGMQVLNLSNNRLSGQIPEFLEDLSLSSLDLAFNDFNGTLPMKGVFGNATAISVVGNQKLCGGIPQLRLPKCDDIQQPKRGKSTSRVRNIILGIVGGLLGLSLFLSFFYLLWFRKAKKETAPSGSGNDFMKVSYQSLVKATDGFSSANLIGTGSFGSVFRGVLDQEQMVVAVKVLDLTRHGASKSFAAECEALRNIRHRNLVKIVTGCSSLDSKGNDFKALVYEFMANGSLDEWIHPPVRTSDVTEETPRMLSLIDRLNIAIDVGFALDYLHNQCETPIIHCDLKPSNVLLNEQLVGHVGDFGLARILPEAAHELISSSIGVKGSFGYIAPEYGAGGNVSSHGDVYSYGILILEMITGKRPTDEMFRDGLSLYSYVAAALPEGVRQIIDPVLLPECTEPDSSRNGALAGNRNYSRFKARESLFSVMEIGVAFSSELPRDRMAIADAVAAFLVIKKKLVGGDG